MNQILVTEKLYITPELRRKKRIYKIRFFLSIFLICLLCSYYIYAENDRNKSEAVSKVILEQIENAANTETTDNTVKTIVNDALIVTMGENEVELAQQSETQEELEDSSALGTYTTTAGITYTTEAILTIPCLGINYPVLSETSEELLKISLNKYWGNGPNKVGNYCIVGHNYASGKMFGKLDQIQIGDTATLKDMNGTEVIYEVYDKYIVNPTDVSCTSQLTQGRREMTLITCKTYGTQRLVVKCREI